MSILDPESAESSHWIGKIFASIFAYGAMARNRRLKNVAWVVIRGRKPGIYESYSDCKAQVNGYSNSYQRGFETLAAAEEQWADHLRSQEIKNISMGDDNSAQPLTLVHDIGDRASPSLQVADYSRSEELKNTPLEDKKSVQGLAIVHHISGRVSPFVQGADHLLSEESKRTSLEDDNSARVLTVVHDISGRVPPSVFEKGADHDL